MEPRLVPAAMTAEMRRLGREAGRTRRPARTLRVGHPDGEVVEVAVRGWYDAGARTDLVTRAIDGLAQPRPLVWLCRTGELEVGDDDLAWLAAAHRAFDALGWKLPCFHVVTRHGWHELIGGRVVHWARVRHPQV